MRRFLIVIVICSCSILYSNDTISFKNKIELSFSNIQIEDDYYWLQDNMVTLQLGFNRNIADYIGIGCFGGIGMFEEWIGEKDSNSISLTFSEYRYSAHYGLNSKLHILPLLLETDIPRFDLYISGNLGLISLFSTPDNNITPERGHYLDYSLMSGGSVYLSRKLGLFIEAGYRKFKYHKGFNAKYGLIFKF